MKRKSIIKDYKNVKVLRFFNLLAFLILSNMSFSQEKFLNNSIDYMYLVKKPIKDTAFIVLPEILVKKDSIIVEKKSYNLKSCLTYKPAKLFKTIKEYTIFVNSYLHNDFTDDDLKGFILVKFIINEDGSISNIFILKGLKKDAEKTVVNFIKSMKKWIPAKNKKNKSLCTLGYLKVNFDIIWDKRKPNKIMESQIKY